MLRLAGGQAAAFGPGSLVVESYTDDGLGTDIRERFEWLAGRIAAALRALGADARVGALPGEYCPGEYSINSAGTLKVAGLSQRVVKDAALTSAVIVVAGGERIRPALVDVYRELAIPWDPATAGALADHHPGIAVADVERAVRAEFAGQPLIADDEATVRVAGGLVGGHRLP